MSELLGARKPNTSGYTLKIVAYAVESGQSIVRYVLQLEPYFSTFQHTPNNTVGNRCLITDYAFAQARLPNDRRFIDFSGFMQTHLNATQCYNKTTFRR